MTKTPKFGISFSFQAHRTLGEPYDKAYREAIELAIRTAGTAPNPTLAAR